MNKVSIYWRVLASSCSTSPIVHHPSTHPSIRPSLAMAGFVKLLNNDSDDQYRLQSPIIRFSQDLKSPISSVFGLVTPSALFSYTVNKYGDKRCLAFRKIIAHVLDTRLLGDWQYYTYSEVGQRVREMGAGLGKLLRFSGAARGKGGIGRSGGVQRLHMAAANRLVAFPEFLLCEQILIYLIFGFFFGVSK